MKYEELTLDSFACELASGAPVPGGGGAAALVGALGAALSSMVGNLTSGKKKYAQYEADIQRIIQEAEGLRRELLACIGEDAKCFEPLSKAYGIPKDDPRRDEVMEETLKFACSAPMSIMRLSAKTIELHSELAEKGSALMLSDVGVGALCCKAALLGASLSVFINIRLMKDRTQAESLKSEADGLIEKYSALADKTYERVLEKLM